MHATATDYRDALRDCGLAFRDPALRECVVEVGPTGVPRARSGAFSSVYRMTRPNGQAVALKLFNFPSEERQRRYPLVAQHFRALGANRPRCLVDFQYAPHGIRVKDQTYPVLTMPWVRGQTLGQWVRDTMQAGDSRAARKLADKWVRVVEQLQDARIAHGDLQHDNILIAGDDIRLVDYDGMCVPAIEGAAQLEFGNPAYQHPLRPQQPLTLEVDTFAAWVIFIALRASAADPALYEQHVVRTDSESLLLGPNDLSAPERSPLWSGLLGSPDPDVRGWSAYLRRALDGVPTAVERLSHETLTRLARFGSDTSRPPPRSLPERSEGDPHRPSESRNEPQVKVLAGVADALDRLGRPVSAFDLLDALLIAPHLGGTLRPPPPPAPPPVRHNSATEPTDTHGQTAEQPRLPPPPEFPIDTAGAKTGAGRAAVAVRLPAGGPPLRGRPLARAFRGFRHRVPSRVRWELDEDGTVLLRAETRLPLVRLRAVRERATTLCLVIDRTASMEVWADTVRALVRTATGAGVFRAVRLLTLDTDGDRPAVGRWHGTPHADRVRPPSGVETVVLVVTDLCSRAWWNGSAFRLFAEWSRLVPVGLMGLLPQTFWPRTAVGRMRLVPLVRPAPAGELHTLAVTGAAAGDVLPVGSLEPRGVGALAGLLGHNRTEARGVGVWVPAAGEAGAPSPPSNPPSAEDIVRRFIAAASPPAVRLAGLLALFHHPTARTLRLVRGAAGLTTEPVHEAEVLLGGLMRGERHDRDGRQVWEYTFHAGVQGELVRRATWGETEPQRFLDRFHSYLERRKGELNGIRAAVPTTGDAAVRGLEDQFLTLNAATLSALGPRGNDLSRLLTEVRQAEAAGPLHRSSGERVADAGGNSPQKYKVDLLGRTGTGKTTTFNTPLGSPPADRKPSNIRLDPNASLVGREGVLDTIRDGATVSPSRQVIVGEPGVSKSHTAHLYADRFRGEYSALLSVTARTPGSLRDGLADLSGEEVLDLTESAFASVKTRSQAVVSWLQRNDGWLLILDDADSPAAITEVSLLVRDLRNGHVLVTSTTADGWGPTFQQIRLGPPDAASAATFLLEKTATFRARTNSDDDDARRLVTELGAVGLFNVIELIRTQGISLAEYRRVWGQSMRRVDEFRPPDAQYPATLAATWLTSFAGLSPAAQQLLRLLAWLAPVPLPLAVLDVYVDRTSLEPLAELLRYSLVFRRTTEDQVTASGLLQSCLRDWMTPDQRETSLRPAVWVLERALLAEKEDARSIFTQLVPHLRAVIDLGEATGFGDHVRQLRSMLRQGWSAADSGSPLRFSPLPSAAQTDGDGLRPLSDYTPGQIVTARVVKKVPGGLEVEFDGLTAFLPQSQVDLRPVDLDEFVGQTVECQIEKVDADRGGLVVNRRKLLQHRQRALKDDLLAALEVGQIRKGVVKSISKSGATLDLDGVDGVLLTSNMSWGKVFNPQEVVSLHQELNVYVLAIDRERSHVTLSLKHLTPDPWENIATKFAPGTQHFGQVANVVAYGAFVELEPGLTGLVHNTEMSWVKRITDPTEVVRSGDRVEVQVLNIDREAGRIALSMMRCRPNPWDEEAGKVASGTRVRGVVKTLTKYGAFVELDDGVTGLLHVNDMRWLGKVTDPSEVVQKGQTITCVVLSSDRDKKRLALGLKQLTPDPWEHDIPARYLPGQRVRGVVSKLVASGAFVELEPGVEGLLHQSDLSADPVLVPEQVVKVGDQVEVRVLRVYPTQRTIALTMRGVAKRSLAYISYASADREFVSRVTAWLRTQGWETWEYQQAERRLSQTLAAEISTTVERADVVLVILSPNWVLSQYCQQELNTAASLRKPVELLTASPFDSSSLNRHLYTAGRQRIDFTRDEEAAYRLLADRLRQIKSA